MQISEKQNELTLEIFKDGWRDRPIDRQTYGQRRLLWTPLGKLEVQN